MGMWRACGNGTKRRPLMQKAKRGGLPYRWITVHTPLFNGRLGEWEKAGRPVTVHTSEDTAPSPSDLKQTSAVATGEKNIAPETGKIKKRFGGAPHLTSSGFRR